jgi:acyl carrier protein
MLNFEDFSERVLDALQIPAPPMLGLEADLYDEVGLDSFQAFQLIVVVESLAGADVPPPQLPEMFTMGDAFRYYEHLVAARPAESSTTPPVPIP